MSKIALSIVIPILNEAASIRTLLKELDTVLKKIPGTAEYIIIDDGSNDRTPQVLQRALKDFPRLTVITHRTNLGKATALKHGFAQAAGKYIVTLDGDLQDNPQDLAKLIRKLDAGYDLVCGWKYRRLDSKLKVLSSKVFNAVTSLFFDGSLHDMNTGYKAYRAELAKELQLYGEMHRYIPLMAIAAGYRVTEVAVRHRARKHGVSKYSLWRFFYGPFDLLTVIYLTKFRHRPLHVFGFLGLGLLSLGFLISLYLTILKIATGAEIGQRPLLLLGVLLILVGFQTIFFGLIGEQLTYHNAGKQVTHDVTSIKKSKS